jgi:hypothetical protein
LPSPPFAPLPSLTAFVNAALSLLKSGTFEQSCGFCAKEGNEHAMNANEATNVRENFLNDIRHLLFRII